MALLRAIGCYVVAYLVLFAISIFFMQGAFSSILPLVALALAVVIYRSRFKPRYSDED